MPIGPMVPLTALPNGFAAKVLAARLGAEGIVWELRGGVDGPYPIGLVQVLVDEHQLQEARFLLLADEIDAIGDAEDGDLDGDEVGERPAVDLRSPLVLWAVLLAAVAVPVVNLARLVLGP